jgi:hypothetical protein
VNVALSEDLSGYARGETFWQAVQNLCEIVPQCSPSAEPDESDLNARLQMYYETGINRVEIFVEPDGARFGVRCANTRSLIAADSEQAALKKYIEAKAKTSVVNTGEVIKT